MTKNNSAAFRAKVPLEAIKGDMTVSEPAWQFGDAKRHGVWRFLAPLLLIFGLLCGPMPTRAFAAAVIDGGLHANLQAATRFSVAAGKQLILQLPHGFVIDLLPTSGGIVASDGVFLEQSACFVKSGKMPTGFALQTNLVSLSGVDCRYFLQNNSKAVKAVVVSGELAARTPAGQNLKIHAGETLLVTPQKATQRKSLPKDTAFWSSEAPKLPGDTTLDKVPKRFGELFIYSLAILEKGGGTVFYADSTRKPATAIDREIIAPTDSKISTGASETARLRLGEKTTLSIAPDSEILLHPAHIEILNGECLVRHGNGFLPVKISGPVALLVEKNSSVEFGRSAETLTVTIHKGNARVSGTDTSFGAGKCCKFSGNGGKAVIVERLPTPAMTAEHLESTIPNFETGILNETEPFWPDEELLPADNGQQPIDPGNLLQQYEIHPEESNR